MKKFLINTAIIISTTLLLSTIITFASVRILRQSIFYLSPDKNIVILGDSHTECAINDNILTNATNLSQSGTGYLYSYCILRELLKTNPQIDTIVLSFFDQSLSKKYDDILYSKDRTKFKLPPLIAFMQSNEISLLTKDITVIINAYLEVPIITLQSIIKSFHYPIYKIGGYLALNRDKLKVDIQRYDSIDLSVNVIDKNTIQYQALEKIKNLCSEKDITLILINTPTYKPELYSNQTVFNQQIKEYLPDFTYRDYSEFKLEDNCFGDIGHLNYKGATKFSTYLKKNGL